MVRDVARRGLAEPPLRDAGRNAAVDPRPGRYRAGGADDARRRTAVTALHYGTYDYSAFCGIPAAYQSMEHPVADHAKLVMQAAAAGTGVGSPTARPTCCPSATPTRSRGWRTTTGWSAARSSAATTRAGTCTRPNCRPGSPRRTPSTARARARGLPTGSQRTSSATTALADRATSRRDRAGTGRLRARVACDCGAAVSQIATVTGPPTPSRCPPRKFPVRMSGNEGRMGIVLGANQYGKAENRVVRIYRDTDRHEIRDLNVSTSLRGDFADAHTDRRPGRGAADRHPEEHRVRLRQGARGHLARGLRDRPGPALLDATPAATAQIRVEEYAWDRIRSAAPATTTLRQARRRGAHHAWSPSTAAATTQRVGSSPASGPGRAEVDRLGVQGLPQGRVHDPAGDRRPDPGHLARGALALRPATDADWNASYEAVQAALLETFATTYSRALQETLYADGQRGARGPARRRRDQVLGAQQAPLPGRPRRRSGWTTTARCSSPPTAPTA